MYHFLPDFRKALKHAVCSGMPVYSDAYQPADKLHKVMTPWDQASPRHLTWLQYLTYREQRRAPSYKLVASDLLY
jgi:hypothetical protein